MLSAIQIAGLLNQIFLQSKSMKQSHFLHGDTNSQKLRVIQSICWCMVKNECDQSGLGNLKLTVSQETTDGTN